MEPSLESFQYQSLGLPGGGISSISGDRHLVEQYRASQADYSRESPTQCWKPSDEDWQCLQEVVRRLRLPQAWDQSSYIDPDILDGEHWSLALTLGSQTVCWSGRNAYPSGYSQLISAIGLLVGEATDRAQLLRRAAILGRPGDIEADMLEQMEKLLLGAGPVDRPKLEALGPEGFTAFLQVLSLDPMLAVFEPAARAAKILAALYPEAHLECELLLPILQSPLACPLYAVAVRNPDERIVAALLDALRASFLWESAAQALCSLPHLDKGAILMPLLEEYPDKVMGLLATHCPERLEEGGRQLLSALQDPQSKVRGAIAGLAHCPSLTSLARPVILQATLANPILIQEAYDWLQLRGFGTESAPVLALAVAKGYYSAVDLLLKCGAESDWLVESLMPLVEHGEKIVSALHNLSQDSPSTVQMALCDWFERKGDQVGPKAVELGARLIPMPISLLLQGLAATSSETRLQAARVLLDSPSDFLDEVLSALDTAVRHDECAEVRCQAAETMAHLQPSRIPQLAALLGPLLEPEYKGSRIRSARLLASWGAGSAPAVEWMEKCLEFTRDAALQGHLRRALKAVGRNSARHWAVSYRVRREPTLRIQIDEEVVEIVTPDSVVERPTEPEEWLTLWRLADDLRIWTNWSHFAEYNLSSETHVTLRWQGQELGWLSSGSPPPGSDLLVAQINRLSGGAIGPLQEASQIRAAAYTGVAKPDESLENPPLLESRE